MNPLEVAARFAAFVWYAEAGAPERARIAPDAAQSFARENWEAFLPVAQKGLGRLLLRIARLPSRKSRKTTRKRCAATAG
jgi:hypothetical protein